ncbi:MAG: hypothetical protein IKP20_07290 [Candidatus Methanomethylophilaceae archaeon]|nr:hypothetical protein [Candidatus Methanomethylophilaceae archaeon]
MNDRERISIKDKNYFKGQIWRANQRCKIGKRVYEDKIAPLADGSSKIVLFPDTDTKVNFYGLLYLDEFLVRNLKKTAVIVTSNNGVAKSANYFTPKIKDIITVSEEEMDGLLALYSLRRNEMEMTVVSLDKPDGRTAIRFKGVRGMTVEQIIAIGVYFLIPFRIIRRGFDFKGMDDEVLDIMKEGM